MAFTLSPGSYKWLISKSEVQLSVRIWAESKATNEGSPTKCTLDATQHNTHRIHHSHRPSQWSRGSNQKHILTEQVLLHNPSQVFQSCLRQVIYRAH